MAINNLNDALLDVQNLCKSFSLDNSFFSWFGKSGNANIKVDALQNVSFSVHKGETLGVLGESGSGKSTLARVLMGIYPADSGKALLSGCDLFAAHASPKERLKILKNMQMIFQDPYGSLDPRMTVRQIISEPFKIHADAKNNLSEEFLQKALAEVGLEKECLDQYPAEFSGGQRQRIGICRSMILDPALVIADEAVSALDVSVQAQILELLCKLRSERKLSMIFISHDVAVVRQISDRIILLYRGNLVEEMSADCLLKDAAHPYTVDLLNSACFLREGSELTEKPKQIDRQTKGSGGCCYRNICSRAFEKCAQVPVATEIHSGHRVFCWHAAEK